MKNYTKIQNNTKKKKKTQDQPNECWKKLIVQEILYVNLVYINWFFTNIYTWLQLF
jgi:hypothetical protein